MLYTQDICYCNQSNFSLMVSVTSASRVRDPLRTTQWLANNFSRTSFLPAILATLDNTVARSIVFLDRIAVWDFPNRWDAPIHVLVQVFIFLLPLQKHLQRSTYPVLIFSQQNNRTITQYESYSILNLMLPAIVADLTWSTSFIVVELFLCLAESITNISPIYYGSLYYLLLFLKMLPSFSHAERATANRGQSTPGTGSKSIYDFR